MDKYILFQISCGLGNQMFQYAFYEKLKFLGRNVKTELEYYKKSKTLYQLEYVFPKLRIEKATKEEISFYSDNKFLQKMRNSKYIRVRRLYDIFSGKKYLMTNSLNSTKFNPYYLYKQEGYFIGFWQNENYFKDIKEYIVEQFTFREFTEKRNIEVAKQIVCSNSVSIHIRKGDYVYLTNLPKEIRIDKIIKKIIWKYPIRVEYDTCGLQYYQEAINYINSIVQNPIYYVFSDDIQWCKENLKLENAVYIDWNIGENSYRDMQLMSICKHNIICNSTFSWWGAYLNKNADKIVVGPQKWFRIDGKLMNSEHLPEEWIKL